MTGPLAVGPEDPGAWAILGVAGFVAGALNVVAGGGSFLTLPVLIFLGLPSTVANATNRVGVVIQSVGGVWGFHRHAVMDWRWGLLASVPCLAGAALGAWAALQVSDAAFRRILALVMVAVTLWTLVDPLKGQGRDFVRLPWSPAVFAGWLGVGLYGGFVQAGVGFLALAVTTHAGLDLVRGNAVKVLTVLALTLLSLLIFVAAGKVDWPMGLALGLGSLLGSLVGVRLTVSKGHAWLRGVVTATVVLFAVRLWFS